MSDSSKQTGALASKKQKGKPPTSDNSQNRKSEIQLSKKYNGAQSPHPLFNTYKEFINHTHDEPDPCLPLVMNYLANFDTQLKPMDGFEAVSGFLRSYSNVEATFVSYRTHSERLLLWALLIRKKPLMELRRADAEAYLAFCMSPPVDWFGPVTRSRFLNVASGRDSTLRPNPRWHPFSAKIESCESAISNDYGPGTGVTYNPSRGSISQAFSVCSSLYEYALDEGLTSANPFRAIKQKSRFKASRVMEQTGRALTPLQWDYALTTAEKMADTEPERHERTLFIAATLFSMYLRVSDVCGRVNWHPTMDSFKADHDGNWWFHLVGKGDKAAKVAVRPEYVDRYLKRYRRFLGLPELPVSNEKTPLIATLNGRPGLSTRMVQSIVQELFDRAVDEMKSEGRQPGEIESLQMASTHWLRHTAATLDAPWRDPKDLQMDLRHNNLSTTQDIYYSSYEEKRSYSLKKLGLKNRD
ncbi:site-specific integrase [Pseudomonas putida]|nr:site-specific integrase [Pseudomonas putida]MDY4320559.1 site-specific integrase [Pseudomonas putida]MDY4353591.1 site-specific integrase [Pseudomonas putida]